MLLVIACDYEDKLTATSALEMQRHHAISLCPRLGASGHAAAKRFNDARTASKDAKRTELHIVKDAVATLRGPSADDRERTADCEDAHGDLGEQLLRSLTC